ncbi:STAS domain-containing protein [Streptacidiphilus sp. PB12-B1b]|uniref:STAS domain-containing protein n=1 Tax=Streptacidiphilus sp. PB12-B1b TaxID=2705012 RepID=UPI0015FE0AD6|nr:STAS domain-containing protein [Streptacidiphilus sp. PB12-B1b]QMU77136.1 STAS domain-containing protein [Streptacidiphilus sp. PB12-B1b]
MAVLVLDGSSTVEVLLAGDLDLDAETVLDPVIADILRDPQVRRIVLDAAMTTFCDSSGLSALIRAQRHAARCGVRLRLTHPSQRLRRVLTATGLLQPLLHPGAEQDHSR